MLLDHKGGYAEHITGTEPYSGDADPCRRALRRLGGATHPRAHRLVVAPGGSSEV